MFLAAYELNAVYFTTASPCNIFYRWSITTIRLSGTVMEIWGLEGFGVTSVTSGVTWHHRSRDH